VTRSCMCQAAADEVNQQVASNPDILVLVTPQCLAFLLKISDRRARISAISYESFYLLANMEKVAPHEFPEVSLRVTSNDASSIGASSIDSVVLSPSSVVSDDSFDVTTPIITSFFCGDEGRNHLEMSHDTNQQQNNYTSAQMPSSDVKYDRYLRGVVDLPCSMNVTDRETGSDASTPLMPASMDQKEGSNVPPLSCGNKPPPPTTRYDKDLQRNALLCPTNVFYTEPGSDSSSPLIPASIEQQGTCNVPLFILRSKPPTITTTSTEVSTYRHCSRLTKKEDAEYAYLLEIGSSSTQRSNARRSSFPKTLYDILSRDDIADIISWCPHGRAWRVHNPKALEYRVLGQHFRHSKFLSFARQVNGWGFRRITQGKDRQAYYHEVRRQTASM
jgi:hypothetical protein